jgi:putative transcriptional regulator
MAGSPPSLAGQLLVSHPQLRDDNFRETVILLHAHSVAEGTIGVVLNRPFGRVLGQMQPDFSETSLADIPLFQGGPVALDRLAFGGWQCSAQGPGEIRYGMGQEEAMELAKDTRFKLFAFIGYAGWSPGQLENELRMNAWVVCPFVSEPSEHEGVELWKKLLELHRPDLRIEADSPDNPGLN